MSAFLLFIACFAAPLVFFTDLTRNPFSMQQLLLSLSLAAVWIFILARGMLGRRFIFYRTAADFPILLFLAVCMCSFVYSYFGHAAFFRPSILNAALKGLLFIAFCIPIFYLSAGMKRERDISISESKSCLRYIVFIFSWGGLWLLYPWLHISGQASSFIGKIFDPYGTFLFIIAFIWLRPFLKPNRNDIFRLLIAVGIIASLYGIFQYFDGEMIWDKQLNSYGRRPVSTFGNPNFLSSYVVMLLPLVSYRLIFASAKAERFFYSLAIFLYTGALICSMARSSWIGAFLGMSFMCIALYVKKKSLIIPSKNKKFLKKISLSVILLVLLFPSGPDNFVPAVADRIADAFSGIIFTDASSEKINPKSSGMAAEISLLASDENFPKDHLLDKKINASLYQRLFMHAVAWQMGLENPLFGKGFAQFEPFNAFYQGRLLASFPNFRDLRTHANGAHNEIAQIWAELGLCGLAAFFLVIAVFARLFSSRMSLIKKEACFSASDLNVITENIQPVLASQHSDLLFIPLASGLFAMLADNMLNVSLHFAIPAALFWYIAGAFIAETNGIRKFEMLFFPKEKAEIANNLKAHFPNAISSFFLSFAVFLFLWASVFQTRIFLHEAYYFLGYKSFRLGKPLEAASFLEQAMGYDSGDVHAAFELSNAWHSAAEPKKAEHALIRAIKANAGYDELYSNLAAVLYSQGRYKEALPFANLSSFINPFSSDAWNIMSKIYISLKPEEISLKDAVSSYSEAESFFPEDPSYANMLGYLYINAGMKKEASALFAKAVKAHPENQMIADNLILASSYSAEGKSALTWIKEYYRLSKILGSFNDSASISKTESGLADLDKMIMDNPNDFRLHELRAKYLFKLNRYSESAREMLYVLEHAERDPNTRYGLAVICENAGQDEMAIKELDLVLRFHPENRRASVRKKMLQKKQI